MTTLINADTITGGAIITGDASGNLALQSGGVTGLTVSAGGAVTFNGPVNGNGGGGATPSGSVTLTAASGGAQAITTTTYGQKVTLPNATTLAEGSNIYNINNLGAYPLKIVNNAGSTLGFVFPNCPVTVGLADNSTAAGTWSLVGAEPYAPVALVFSTDLYNKTAAATARKTVVIDANRTLILLGNSTLYGIIYDASTLLWGAVTTIRSGTIIHFEAILSATDEVLVTTSIGTSMNGVVLTLSGTTITVGSETSVTLSTNDGGSVTAGNLIAVGSSFVITYDASTLQMRAITISAGTVTIGSATILNGTNATASANIYTTAVSSSVVLVLSNTAANTFYATPYTISGTTITAGSTATYSSPAADQYQVRPISNGARTAVCITGSSSFVIGLIISVTGTTASISSAQLTNDGTADPSLIATIVSGSKLILLHGANNGRSNILTDNAGTASAGTQIGPTLPLSTVVPISANATTNLATFYTATAATNAGRVVLNFTGSSPILVDYDWQSGGTSNFSTATALNYKQTFTPTLLIGSSSYVWNGVVTGQKAVAIGENNFSSFYAKFLPIDTPINSITQNKVIVYDTSYGNSTRFGTLQIIESIS
jgi:hypothetical protein